MTRFIVGTGEHVYEIDHPFGKLSAGISWGNPSHVATDSSGKVYVYQRKDPPILIFESDGQLVGSWGDGQLMDAHGIFITPNDEVFVADRDAHEVIKYDIKGNALLKLGHRERPALQEPFNHPADIAVSPSGDIFVADGYANSSIHHFSSNGDHIKSWGSWGSGPGQFITPHGIWVANDRVYVCDRENNRVQIFSTIGEYITEWTGFFHPMDIFIDSKNVAYVSDQVPGMTMLDLEGNMITRIRTPFNAHGVWVDIHGNIYTSGNAELVTKYIKL